MPGEALAIIEVASALVGPLTKLIEYVTSGNEEDAELAKREFVKLQSAGKRIALKRSRGG